MSKRTVTRIVSSILAAAALTVGATAPIAQAAPAKGKIHTTVQYRDTGWD